MSAESSRGPRDEHDFVDGLRGWCALRFVHGEISTTLLDHGDHTLCFTFALLTGVLLAASTKERYDEGGESRDGRVGIDKVVWKSSARASLCQRLSKNVHDSVTNVRCFQTMGIILVRA